MKLGSLFDGSGGFPLAGALNGVEPVWASEIEPFPIRVTTARFPNMKHLGDICQIDGSRIEPVDIITFGSPCQDLSVAGKQKGIHKGERSNLFFEAIRIIKEMRQATDGRYPRFIVWENVPGAFSSNKGEDFRAVLEAIGSIMEDGLSISRPKKWGHAGAMVGKGWSVAWRVYDAQYWPSTPQRRKRIYLIADFATERAREILFEYQGLSGDYQSSGKTGEDAAADAEGGIGGSGSVITFKERAGKPGGGKGILTTEGRSFTLSTNVDESVCYALDSMSSNSMKSSNPNSGFHEEQISRTLDTKPDPTCNQGGNVIVQKPTEIISLEGNGQRPSHSGDGYSEEQVSYTLNATEQHGVCYGVDCRNGVLDNEKTHTIQAKNGSGISLNCTPSVLYETPVQIDNDRPHAVCYEGQNVCVDDKIAFTLQSGRPDDHHIPGVVYESKLYEMQHACDVIRENEDIAPTLQHRMGTGGITSL